MSESPTWRVIITPRAEKELKHLDPCDQARVRRALDSFVSGPGRVDIKKLRNRGDEWRLRVGDWRIRFRMDYQARTIVVLHILPRGTAYRD